MNESMEETLDDGGKPLEGQDWATGPVEYGLDDAGRPLAAEGYAGCNMRRYEVDHPMEEDPASRLGRIEFQALLIAFKEFASDRILLNSGCHGATRPSLIEKDGEESAITVTSFGNFLVDTDCDTRLADGTVMRRTIHVGYSDFLDGARSLEEAVARYYGCLESKWPESRVERIEMSKGPKYPEPGVLRPDDVPTVDSNDELERYYKDFRAIRKSDEEKRRLNKFISRQYDNAEKSSKVCNVL